MPFNYESKVKYVEIDDFNVSGNTYDITLKSNNYPKKLDTVISGLEKVGADVTRDESGAHLSFDVGSAVAREFRSMTWMGQISEGGTSFLTNYDRALNGLKKQ